VARTLCHPPSPSTTYTLSLHDALPICYPRIGGSRRHEGRVGTATPGMPIISSHVRVHIHHGPGGEHRSVQRLKHALLNGHSRHRSEEHTSELQSRSDLVCRLLLEKKNN